METGPGIGPSSEPGLLCGGIGTFGIVSIGGGATEVGTMRVGSARPAARVTVAVRRFITTIPPA